MNIEKYIIDYSKLKVGDKLWSIQLGDCKVVSIKPVETSTFPVICGMRDKTISYTDDGKLGRAEAFPSLFTSNPFVEVDSEYEKCLIEWRQEFDKFKQHHAADALAYELNGIPESANPESILQEAERLINGDRREAYGDAHENFTNIAIGWEVIFRDGVTAEKVAVAMIWLKICRFLNKASRDSIVDIAGYAGCLEKIMKGGKK